MVQIDRTKKVSLAAAQQSSPAMWSPIILPSTNTIKGGPYNYLLPLTVIAAVLMRNPENPFQLLHA
jgi:hypothetical protein